MTGLTWHNPVLSRELRERVQSKRTMYMLTIWVAVLAGIVALYYQVETSNAGFNNQFGSGGGNALRLATVGQSMFEWALFFMVGLVCFLVPGFTAASIAGERERQTLVPMQVSLLRPLDIVLGKVAASLVFTVLLVIASLPIVAFAYLVGGITVGDIVKSLGVMLFSALALSCITVGCSSLVKRVPGAIVSAYGMVVLLVVGSFIAFGIAGVIDDSRGFDEVNPPTSLLAMNPLVAIADVSGEPQLNNFFGNGPETPLAVVREILYINNDGRANGGFNGPLPPGVIFGPDGAPFPVPIGPNGGPIEVFNERGELVRVVNPGERFGDGISFLLRYFVVMTVLSVLSLFVAARRLRAPAKSDR